MNGLRAIRSLRSELLDLAVEVDEAAGRTGYLVLVDSSITAERLQDEMAMFRRVVRPQIMRRFHVVSVQRGQHDELPAGTPLSVRREIELLVSAVAKPSTLPRPDSTMVIGQLLVCHWLRRTGPVALKQIVQESGYSYPTVAQAMKQLGEALTRRARNVELARFPRSMWARIAVMSDRQRSTVRFVDRSGSPRSPEKLLHRVARLKDRSIAVGGVFGALHYTPSLDIVGSPRLDLTRHSPNGESDLCFVSELDPALRISDQVAEPAALVVHHLRRRESLFETGRDGVLWADPSECLLDLHEMRLEPQAREFVHAMRSDEESVQ